MKFYRPLKRIEAITFDLDDTLYDNYDVIRRTDTETLKSIQGFHPALADMSPDAIRQMRTELLAQDAEIYHDVTEWRRQAVHLAMTRAGLSDDDAKHGTKVAMETFAEVAQPDLCSRRKPRRTGGAGRTLAFSGDHQRQCRSARLRSGAVFPVHLARGRSWPGKTLRRHV